MGVALGVLIRAICVFPSDFSRNEKGCGKPYGRQLNKAAPNLISGNETNTVRRANYCAAITARDLSTESRFVQRRFHAY
jgi:hypothetical protein